jgi:hypothetical protein
MAADSVLATSVTLSTIGSGLLAYLKSAKWAPWFNKHSAKINHTWLVLTSLGGALGIGYVWNPGDHSLLITGLSLIAIGRFAWGFTKQWCMQYVVQRGVFGPVAIPGDAPAPAATLVAPVPNPKI